jgi:hypothetical protein
MQRASDGPSERETRKAMSEDASRRWMTYAEIATALGLPSAKAGESRARRAKWERQIGNDGFARVAVPLSALDDPAPPRRPYEAPPKAPPASPMLAELKAAHEALLAEALRRANTAEARLAEAERQLAEVPALREAIGAAKGETAALREAVQHERAEHQATQRELAEWTAGGPLARAWRAFLNRRGRP